VKIRESQGILLSGKYKGKISLTVTKRIEAKLSAKISGFFQKKKGI